MISHQPGSSSSIPRRFGVRPGLGRNVGRNRGEKPGENVGKHRENLGKHGENTSKPGILMRIWEDDRFLIDRLLPFWGGMCYFWAKSEPWSHLGWKEVLSVTHAISRFFWDIHLDFRRTFFTFCNTLILRCHPRWFPYFLRGCVDILHILLPWARSRHVGLILAIISFSGPASILLTTCASPDGLKSQKWMVCLLSRPSMMYFHTFPRIGGRDNLQERLWLLVKATASSFDFNFDQSIECCPRFFGAQFEGWWVLSRLLMSLQKLMGAMVPILTF